MCIIVDPPVFVPMFKPSDPDHADFLPVRMWVENGVGKFIFGGSQYKSELSCLKTVLIFLAELERRGRVVRFSDKDVDREVGVVKLVQSCADFDDPHLVALVRVSGCKLICLRDRRAHKYLKNIKYYSSGKDRPSLYTSSANVKLLRKDRIAACCK